MLLLVCLLGGNAACGGGSESAAAPRVNPEAWAVLGSSTAAGVGAPADQGWAALLSAAYQPRGVVLNNLARSGLLTSQALPMGTSLTPGRAPPDSAVNIDRALTLSPKLVILAFPTNDAMAGVPAAETVGHWQLIGQRAAQAGAAALVLSTQPRDGLNAAQRAILDDTDRRAAEAFGACFVAVRADLSDAQGRIAPAYAAGDGVHLNAEGHRIVSERVMAVLASGRCVRPPG
ncbi:MAG TPA: SGNH/GDSL hydrolase family protein [Burkholderiaceae bacterium]